MFKMFMYSTIASNSIWETQENRLKFEAYGGILLNYVQKIWGLPKRIRDESDSDYRLLQSIEITGKCVQEISSTGKSFYFVRNLLALNLLPIVVSSNTIRSKVEIPEIKIHRLAWSISNRTRSLEFQSRVNAFVWMMIFISLLIWNDSAE